MGYLFIIGVIIVGIALLLAAAASKSEKSKPDLQYRLLPELLSKAELGFYGPLLQATSTHDVTVFSKVRVADVLAPVKSSDRKIWQRAFNAISSKHFDFVVCRNIDSKILLAIELDDKSHATLKAQKRDRIVNSACETAWLPLLRFQAKRGYVVVDIRSAIEKALGLSSSNEDAGTSSPNIVEASTLATPLTQIAEPIKEEWPSLESNQVTAKPAPITKLSTSKMARALKLTTPDYLRLLVNEGFLSKSNDSYQLTEKAMLIGAEKKVSARSGEYFIWPGDLKL
jgi:hypothetical protein